MRVKQYNDFGPIRTPENNDFFAPHSTAKLPLPETKCFFFFFHISDANPFLSLRTPLMLLMFFWGEPLEIRVILIVVVWDDSRRNLQILVLYKDY